MASPKTKKLNRLNLFSHHKKLTFILLVIVLGVIAGFIYQRVALELNKRSFQQARSAIDSVYADIVRQVGPPDDYKKISSCSKTYKEFSGYRDLTCGLDSISIYSVSDENQANSIFKAVQQIISYSNDFRATSSLSPGITDHLVVNSNYHAASDSYKVSGLACTVNYIFDTPQETSLKINDITKKPFEITIGCYGPAKKQYYPLAY